MSLIVFYTDAQVVVHFHHAELAFSESNYKLTIEEASLCLLEDAEHTDALLLRGKAYHELKYYREALNDFTKALDLDPSLADAYASRGYIFFITGDYRLARLNYIWAIDEDKVNPLYYFNLGCIYSKELKWKDAVNEYTLAIHFKPCYYDAFVNRADAEGILKNFTAALNDYDSALRIQPHNPELYILRGMNLISLKRNAEAIEMFNRSLKYKPQNGNAYYSRGRALFDLGQFTYAKANFDSAIMYIPTLGIAYFNRGVALLELGKTNTKDACKDFKIAANLGFGGAWDYLKKYCE
ncbi:MAG: tetratricopeptide repeat protein [Bacteroidia bacterium]|nr:tetratricopeptide repeat protein [Bacteroidia bacterium]